VAAAAPIFADRPYEQVTLEEIAATAGVRRGLLYHYFPDGKAELFAAVYEFFVFLPIGRLTSDLQLPADQRAAMNLAQFLDVAERDTTGYRIHREAQRVSDPAFVAVFERARHAMVDNLVANHFPDGDPGPLVAAALGGYLRFAETVIDTWIDRNELTRIQVTELLSQTLADVLARARELA
jgi:AcrR family transcriptional regulator